MNDDAKNKTATLSTRSVNSPKSSGSWSRVLWRLSGGRLLLLSDPIDPRPRFGYGTPAHPELSRIMDANAVDDAKTNTRIHSIDPAPRSAIDLICDETYRLPLEQLDLEIFEQLEAGDLLFIDSSHRVMMGSDVSVIFLEILPRLRPGVFVHFHDIWLPYDYPPRWRFYHFSEQYILATLLLAAPTRYDIWMPNRYVHEHEGLGEILAPLWTDERLSGIKPNGAGSFWYCVRH